MIGSPRRRIPRGGRPGRALSKQCAHHLRAAEPGKRGNQEHSIIRAAPPAPPAPRRHAAPLTKRKLIKHPYTSVRNTRLFVRVCAPRLSQYINHSTNPREYYAKSGKERQRERITVVNNVTEWMPAWMNSIIRRRQDRPAHWPSVKVIHGRADHIPPALLTTPPPPGKWRDGGASVSPARPSGNGRDGGRRREHEEAEARDVGRKGDVE